MYYFGGCCGYILCFVGLVFIDSSCAAWVVIAGCCGRLRCGRDGMSVVADIVIVVVYVDYCWLFGLI